MSPAEGYDSVRMRKRHAWPPHQLVINTDREGGDRHRNAHAVESVFEMDVKFEKEKWNKPKHFKHLLLLCVR